VALKIAVTDPESQHLADHELNISQRIDKDPTHPGYPFVRSLLDGFQITGPHGKHACLVYEPMRESLWRFQHRFGHGRLPPTVLKVYVKVLLLGLDYLHSVCHIIHTDLKGVNILVGFENPSVIERYLKTVPRDYNTSKVGNGRMVYSAVSDFGHPETWDILPQIADFGLARPGDTGKTFREPIQAPLYTAPEVLMGTGWNYSADIWNLGVLIWSLQEGVELFSNLVGTTDRYSGRAHVAEMIALLGKPPKQMLDREKLWKDIGWEHAFRNSTGKLCVTPQEYYEGPFFSDEGEFLYKDMVPQRPVLDDSVMSMSGEEKVQFLDFIKRMLSWLPEERESARALSEHPWLRYDE